MFLLLFLHRINRWFIIRELWKLYQNRSDNTSLYIYETTAEGSPETRPIESIFKLIMRNLFSRPLLIVTVLSSTPRLYNNNSIVVHGRFPCRFHSQYHIIRPPSESSYYYLHWLALTTGNFTLLQDHRPERIKSTQSLYHCGVLLPVVWLSGGGKAATPSPVIITLYTNSLLWLRPAWVSFTTSCTSSAVLLPRF